MKLWIKLKRLETREKLPTEEFLAERVKQRRQSRIIKKTKTGTGIKIVTPNKLLTRLPVF